MDYTIQKGDNLTKIAQSNNTTVDNLASINKISDINKINEGQVIKLNNTQVNPPTENLFNNTKQTNPIAFDSIQNTDITKVPVSKIEVTQPTTPNLVQDLLNKTQVEETSAQTQSRDLSNKISGLLPNTMGQTEALQEAERQAGVNSLIKNLNDINSQILLKQADLNKDDVSLAAGIANIEDKPIAMEFITGQQASIQRQAQIARAFKNAEINTLNARAIGLQGNIELAKQMAQDAVEAKYAPIKEMISLYKAQLEAIQPILSADEKKVSREQELKTKLALQEIDKLSAFQSNALSAAISNNAPQSVLNAINKAQSIEDISKVGSNWIISKADKLDQALKQAQLSKIYSEITPSGDYIVNNNQYSKEQYTAGEQAGNIKNILSGINTAIKNKQGFQGAVGAGFQKLPIVSWFVGDETSQFGSGTDARTFDLKVQQLKNALALPNLSSLKGAMSDKDIMFLKNIATSLDTGMTEKEFSKELKNIDNSLSNVEKKYNINLKDFTNEDTNIEDAIDKADEVLKNFNNSSYKTTFNFTN